MVRCGLASILPASPVVSASVTCLRRRPADPTAGMPAAGYLRQLWRGDGMRVRLRESQLFELLSDPGPELFDLIGKWSR